MANIYDTEVSIVKNVLSRDEIRVTKLAGLVGEESLKLHQNINDAQYIRIALYLDEKYYGLQIESTYKSCALIKNKKVIFFFSDGTVLEKSTIMGRHKLNGHYRNNVFVTNKDFTIFSTIPLDKIYFEEPNFYVEFLADSSYENKKQGQMLLKEVAKKLVEYKQNGFGEIKKQVEHFIEYELNKEVPSNNTSDYPFPTHNHNPVTKYGRKKIRQDFEYRYHNKMTSEQKTEVDIMRFIVIAIIVGIVLLIVYLSSGSEGLLRYLSR